MPATIDPAVPKGSTVLVTGANGFVGAHVVDQYLRNGYKVRGAVRDPKKEEWMVEALGGLYGMENLELVTMPDVSGPGVYDKIVEGVQIVVHTVSVLTFDKDPSKVIPQSIDGALNALKAAYVQPSVKRFVLTSSAFAATGELYENVSVDEFSWNSKGVESAWSEGGDPYRKAKVIYEASKVQTEQAIWRHHNDNRYKRPDLVVNTVLPDLVMGRPICAETQGFRSTSGMVKALWDGFNGQPHDMIMRQYCINVVDVGRLHYAAGVFQHVQNQRIFGFAHIFTWDGVLDILREIDPERKLPAKFSNIRCRNTIVRRPQAEQLLKDMGHPGFIGLRETVAENIREE